MNENPNVWDEAPGPYDVVGDVHGCIDELGDLLFDLGYVDDAAGGVSHPDGRVLVFLGDLADRGPGSFEVWRLVLASIESGAARFVPGNHDAKLVRYLQGRNVRVTHGFEETVRQFNNLPNDEREHLREAIVEMVLDSPPYRIFDGGKLVVAHAGLEEWMIGSVTREISIFARYGEPTGEYTALGLPIRRDWVRTYTGDPLIVYGHTPTPEPVIFNNTTNIDQGCVFGGALTAFRYPELETVSIPARRTYAHPSMADRAADHSYPLLTTDD
jgi:protein phosphatase